MKTTKLSYSKAQLGNAKDTTQILTTGELLKLYPYWSHSNSIKYFLNTNGIESTGSINDPCKKLTWGYDAIEKLECLKRLKFGGKK